MQAEGGDERRQDTFSREDLQGKRQMEIVAGYREGDTDYHQPLWKLTM